MPSRYKLLRAFSNLTRSERTLSGAICCYFNKDFGLLIQFYYAINIGSGNVSWLARLGVDVGGDVAHLLFEFLPSLFHADRVLMRDANLVSALG